MGSLPGLDAFAHVALATAPASPAVGWEFYSTTYNKLRIYNGDWESQLTEEHQYKRPARVATTGPIAGATYSATGGSKTRGQFTTMPNVVDGVSLAAGNRVLVKDQASADQNGIWTVTTLGTGANGTWDRSVDFDVDSEVTAMVVVGVEEGSSFANTIWMLTNANTITIGGSSGTLLTFVRVSPDARVMQVGQLTTDVNVPITATTSATSVPLNGLAVNFVKPANAVLTTVQATCQFASASLAAAQNIELILYIADTNNSNAILSATAFRTTFYDTTNRTVMCSASCSYLSWADATGTLLSFNARAYIIAGAISTITNTVLGSNAALATMMAQEWV